MADNLPENSESPLNLPKRYVKPVNPKSPPECIERNKNYVDYLARQGGSGGNSLDVPTFQRDEQQKFPKLPKAKSSQKISKN